MAKEYPYGTGAVKWVSTDWLANHLGSPMTILDAQPNIHDYIAEHLPGAIYFHEGLLRSYEKHIPGVYIPADALQSILRRLGVQADVPVLVYTGTGTFSGWGDGLGQTMVAYSLARFGHPNILVLDGGLDKWKAESRPLTQEFPEVKPSEFTVTVHNEFVAGMQEIKEMLDPNLVVLDARSPEVYEGQGPWSKPGHIPGSLNLPWKSLMDDENKALLKPDAEILGILDRYGLDQSKSIVCSCGTGREATNEFLLFKHYLGYPDVRIYEGAFTEWTAYPNNRVVTGKSPG